MIFPDGKMFFPGRKMLERLFSRLSGSTIKEEPDRGD